ncbi:hypothetical protein [Nocardia sp. NPDC051570]|uniref:hypothetical protein n=1 Tax=Nocardia sp. NPDC051570 TaxID=3364324 RepID=UPI00379FA81C
MTEQEGTLSGDLDVAVDSDGTALVRYRATDTWYTIGNLDGTPPLRWPAAADLAAAVESVAATRDTAGNTTVFET